MNRAEEALSDGVTALQTLVGERHITCLPHDHLAYGEVIRDHVFVQAIDVVDSNGVPMCSTPVRERSGEAIVPAYREDAAMVGLGFSTSPSKACTWRPWHGTSETACASSRRSPPRPSQSMQDPNISGRTGGWKCGSRRMSGG
ncbi:hypothetical protein [Breoghania sp.]|uniref:hypothetical protein n=1 Tax=Breoghania sp. TaxID=2065378 RepID=UPI00262B4F8F|nr:hypothetical protein [Breoghania sp.]MDJ0930811.1 hypothetical protein [Breoghania sp.]